MLVCLVATWLIWFSSVNAYGGDISSHCHCHTQVEERGKLVCQPDGYYPSLTTDDVTVT